MKIGLGLFGHNLGAWSAIEEAQKALDSPLAKLHDAYKSLPEYQISQALAKLGAISTVQSLSEMPELEAARLLGRSPAFTLNQTIGDLAEMDVSRFLGSTYATTIGELSGSIVAESIAKARIQSLSDAVANLPDLDVARNFSSLSAFTVGQAIAALEENNISRMFADSKAAQLNRLYIESPAHTLGQALADSPLMKMAGIMGAASSYGLTADEVAYPAVKMLRMLTEGSSTYLSSLQETLENSSVLGVASKLAARFQTNMGLPSTLGDAYEEMLRLYDIEAERDDTDPIEAVTSAVEDKLTKPGKSALSLEFYLSMLATLLIFVHQQRSGEETEKRFLHQLQHMETAITEQLAALERFERQETFYVVERSTHLLDQPESKLTGSTFLYPNQKVRLVASRGKWIHVEYFDYRENLHKSGWVYKKYLKIMNPRVPETRKQ